MSATLQEALEILDNWAAEDPLGALREGIAEYLSDYRRDVCACAEPLAALVYCPDLLTPERLAACQAAVERDGGALKRYVPDRHAPERLTALRMVLNQQTRPIGTPAVRDPSPPPRRERTGPRTVSVWTIACEICGTEFQARRADARCCSARCRQKAARARRRGSPDADSQGAGTCVPGYL